MQSSIYVAIPLFCVFYKLNTIEIKQKSLIIMGCNGGNEGAPE